MMPGGPGGAKVARVGKGASLGFRLGCRRILSLNMYAQMLRLPFIYSSACSSHQQDTHHP